MKKARAAGKDVNKAELAQIMGVSLPTINAWVAKGCPVVEEGGRGRSWKLNTESVRRWREALAVEDVSGGDRDNMASLDRRLKLVQVEREELSLAKDKAQVAPVEQFERTMISVFAKVRAQMRMLPPRVALLLVGKTDESTIRAILTREIDDALRDLGTSTLTDDGEV